MEGYYLSAETEGGATLCISPLNKRTAEAGGWDWRDALGYFLYRREPGDRDNVTILARLDSEEAAFDLAGLLRLA